MKKFLLWCLMLFPTSSFAKEIRVLELNRAASTMTLINYSTQTINFNNYQCSIELTYFPLFTKPLVSGSLLMAPMGTVKLGSITLPDLTPGASVALWFPGSLPSSPNALNMLDFLQYGSVGHTYESVAITKGIWTGGDKIPHAFPYLFIGDSLDYGSQYYITGGLGLSEFADYSMINVFPNPCTVSASISIEGDFSKNQPFTIELMKSDGALLRKAEEISESALMIETGNLAAGQYLLRFINAERKTATVRFVKEE